MKTGMDHSGREITGIEYLRQRIQDAFLTVKGSVPLRRGYGSELRELLDKNVDDEFLVEAYERVVKTFINPDNGLDDCTFKRLEVSAESDIATLTVVVEFENEEIELKGLNYA